MPGRKYNVWGINEYGTPMGLELPKPMTLADAQAYCRAEYANGNWAVIIMSTDKQVRYTPHTGFKTAE